MQNAVISELEKRYRTITESQSDAIITSDSSRCIKSWNRGAEKMFGYSSDEATGNNIEILIPERFRDLHHQGMNRAVSGKAIDIAGNTVELVALHKSGKEFPIELTLGAWEDSGNKYFSAIIRDITERKKSEESFQYIIKETSEVTGDDFFEYIVYHLTLALDVNMAFVAERTSSGMNAKILAYIKHQVVLETLEYDMKGTPCEGTFYGDDVFFSENVGSIFPESSELHSIQASGFYATPIVDSEGKILGHLSVADSKPIEQNDFFKSILAVCKVRIGAEMERLKIVRELEENKNKMQAVLYSSPDIIVVINENWMMEEIFTSRKDVLNLLKNPRGRYIKEIIPEDAFRSILTQIIDQKKETGISVDFPMQESDKKMYFSALGSKISASTEKNKYMFVLRDQTEKIEMEKYKEDMEHVMRHDLKSPLNGIIGFSQLIPVCENRDNIDEFSQLIYNSGKRMLNMINNSLNLHKMEEGSYVLNPEKVELLSLFRHIEREFQNDIEKKNVLVKYYINGHDLQEDSDCFVKGEEILLLNLFENLFKNALEASPDGESLTIFFLSENANQKVVIHNQGVIPEEIQPVFFNRYATSGKAGGSGIGTYSAKLVAKTHGGDIQFTSDYSSGTTLSVTLPA